MLQPISVKIQWLRIIRISSLVSPKLPERRCIPIQFCEFDRKPAFSGQLSPLEARCEMWATVYSTTSKANVAHWEILSWYMCIFMCTYMYVYLCINGYIIYIYIHICMNDCSYCSFIISGKTSRGSGQNSRLSLSKVMYKRRFYMHRSKHIRNR